VRVQGRHFSMIYSTIKGSNILRYTITDVSGRYGFDELELNPEPDGPRLDTVGASENEPVYFLYRVESNVLKVYEDGKVIGELTRSVD